MEAILAYLSGWSVAAVICLVVGLALLIAEMFIPGFGLFGALGIITLIASIVLSASTFTHALITLLIIILLVGLAAVIVFRSIGRGNLARSPIVLRDNIDYESNDLGEKGMQELIGRKGVCLTPLRPSGNADFGGKRLDVVTSGEFISKGSYIRIESIENLRVLVREISQDEYNSKEEDKFHENETTGEDGTGKEQA